MKNLRLLSPVLCLLLSALGLHAQPVPTATTADAAYAAFEALRNEPPPAPPREMGAGKFLTWRDTQFQKITAAGLKFYQSFPGDVRRWDVVMAITARPPLFARSFGPDVEQKGMGVAIVDEPAKVAWDKTMVELQQALLDSADAPEKHRESVEWGRFGKDFSAQSAARRQGEKFAYTPFRARFEAHVAKYATMDIMALRATDYLGALEKNAPGSTEEIWRQLLDAPSEKLREAVTARLKFLDLTSKPLDIAFTAVDGRKVDLKDLRGKVVLIDFWATWCGPCIAELPNVKKVYAAYRDQGFEVVGIALENGKLTPKDPPEQVATKLEAAKKVLNDFTAKNEMSWPQYFDGKYWKNDISTQYDIKGIPAMFLLDQDGKVVSTNARGELLEKEVKRLLKL